MGKWTSCPESAATLPPHPSPSSQGQQFSWGVAGWVGVMIPGAGVSSWDGPPVPCECPPHPGLSQAHPGKTFGPKNLHMAPSGGAQAPGPHKADQQSGPAVHRSPEVGPPPSATLPAGEEEGLFRWELPGFLARPPCSSVSTLSDFHPPNTSSTINIFPQFLLVLPWLLRTLSSSCAPPKTHFPPLPTLAVARVLPRF